MVKECSAFTIRLNSCTLRQAEFLLFIIPSGGAVWIFVAEPGIPSIIFHSSQLAFHAA